MFHKWEQRHQEEFLDFCTGVRGIKLMYDGFFKEIFNPEYVPERLEEVLVIQQICSLDNIGAFVV